MNTRTNPDPNPNPKSNLKTKLLKTHTRTWAPCFDDLGIKTMCPGLGFWSVLKGVRRGDGGKLQQVREYGLLGSG